MNPRLPLIAASLAFAPWLAGAAQLMSAPVALATPQESASLVAQLTALDARAGLTADYSFRISSQHPGVVGQKIVRAQHTYKNLRVFGSESVVVSNAAGEIVSVSSADRRPGIAPQASMPGETAPGPVTAPASPPPLSSATAPPSPAELTPTLSGDDAVNAAVQAIAPSATHRWPPSAELLIYPVMKTVRSAAALNKPADQLNALDVEEVVDHYELAYLVQLRMAQDGKLIYYDVVVKARNGEIIARWPALQTVIGTGNSQYNGVVPISTSPTAGGFQMLDATRGSGGKFGGMAITNANHSSPNSPDPGDIYSNSSNTWGDGQQYNGGGTTTANGQTAAVNALWGLMNTYDANKNVLGWQSLDGNNTATYIAAHIGTAYDNAFYDDSCLCMYIGDGNSFTSLGAIDVIGHEMSHGVTAATADLIYTGESGGLNESHSDIGGEMVEAYARRGGAGAEIPAAGNDWMLGTEISKSGQPLRWMYRPGKDGSSQDAWSSGLKDLDVHYSSGPNNRMFYFLAQGSKADASSDYHSPYLNKAPAAMTGIGSDKAYRIWFKALTTKFTSSTNYADARNKVLQAAQELYGNGSREAIAVQRAYAAINVGADIDEAGGSDGGGDGGESEAVEQVVNGGFEDGITGWSGSTGVIGAHDGQTPHQGSRFAWLGGNGRRTNETLTQQLQIPATASSIQLSFALHIDTDETSNTVYDTLTVSLRAGGASTTLATYTNLTPAGGYQLRSFDLLPFKGQTITLSFAMLEDRSKQTSFVLDKVSLLTK
ncbi:M4 family metallopeptidase [Duganella sp. sic0402]|uniref:M4 family metallopeptidase n=1 Tax=Duganella sp. sic0402 TaxID=2854786 RepID=UPI001C4961A0|nr:M4 family metallopeptidase [Duganella sp. sic0402]MBV7537294.1 M4 family metallopeptidase [Duganella sp. sic0402]